MKVCQMASGWLGGAYYLLWLINYSDPLSMNECGNFYALDKSDHAISRKHIMLPCRYVSHYTL